MFAGREEGGEIGVDGSELANIGRDGESGGRLAIHEDLDGGSGLGSGSGGGIEIELANEGLQDVDGGLGGIPDAVAIFVFEEEESAFVKGGFESGRGVALLFSGGEGIED